MTRVIKSMSRFLSRPMLVVAAYALLALLVIPVFPHFVSPNELTRWLLAASLVEDGTVEVTRLAPMLGPRFEDLAEIDGRLVSNKAPGAAFVALPGYLAGRAVAGPPSPNSMRVVLTAMRLVASTLPVLALAWLLIRVGRRRGIPDDRIAVVVATLLFATPLFTYGLLLFSHALVAAALFGAWVAFDERRDLTAGALMGLAVLSEYPALVPVAVLLAATWREPRRLMRIIAGAAPFALLLALYHYVAYGSIFGLPFGHDTLPQFREVAASGVAGVSFPSPVTLVKLLAHPGKGLLVFSPVLAIAFVAAARQAPRLLGLTAASLILVYSGYANWHGGWTVGPRYIVPAIPFLVAALLFREGGRLESLLAGASCFAVVMTTLVFPFVPNAFSFPWMSLALPLLGDGLVAPNLLHLVARPLAIAVPFLLAALAFGYAYGIRRVPYLLAGALLAIVAGSREPAPAVQWQRAYIAEVYFERRGALGDQVPQGLAQRRAQELPLPPPGWSF